MLILIAGTAYVYYSDRNVKPKPLKSATAQQVQPLPPPAAPGVNNAEGVSVQSVSSPVTLGADASISILTNAGSKCDISVSSNGVQIKTPALNPAIANAYGSVSWTWPIANTAAVGNWPISVTCYYHNRSGVVDSSLQVTK